MAFAIPPPLPTNPPRFTLIGAAGVRLVPKKSEVRDEFFDGIALIGASPEHDSAFVEAEGGLVVFADDGLAELVLHGGGVAEDINEAQLVPEGLFGVFIELEVFNSLLTLQVFFLDLDVSVEDGLFVEITQGCALNIALWVGLLWGDGSRLFDGRGGCYCELKIIRWSYRFAGCWRLNRWCGGESRVVLGLIIFTGSGLGAGQRVRGK
jgi:hypothetical protein